MPATGLNNLEIPSPPSPQRPWENPPITAARGSPLQGACAAASPGVCTLTGFLEPVRAPAFLLTALCPIRARPGKPPVSWAQPEAQWLGTRTESPPPAPPPSSTAPLHTTLVAQAGSFSCIRQSLGQQEEGMVRSQRAGVRKKQCCSYCTAACRLSKQSPAPSSVHGEPSPQLCPRRAQPPALSTGSPAPPALSTRSPAPRLCPWGAQPPALSPWSPASSSVHVEPSPLALSTPSPAPRLCPHGP